jgi:hypothetical protein
MSKAGLVLTVFICILSCPIKASEVVVKERVIPAEDIQRTRTILSKDKHLLIKNLAGDVDKLANVYALENKSNSEHASYLDDIFSKWLADTSQGKPSSDQIVEILGASFGEYIVQKYSFEWQIVTDNIWGASLGIHQEKTRVDLFPFDIVLKRVSSGEINFFVAIEQSMLKSMKEMKIEWPK